MSCVNSFGNINETYIIEPLLVTDDTLTACTGVYTNVLYSCSGDTSISLGSGLIIISGDVVSSNITGNTINAATYFSGGTNLLDIFVSNSVRLTGGTFDSNQKTLTLVNSDGNNVIVTGFTDYYTTGVTYNNNTFTFTTNNGDVYSTTFNELTGLTINGNLNVTGDTILQGVTATTISATTYFGDGSQLTGINSYALTASTQSGNQLFLFNSTGGTESYLPNAVTGGSYSNGTIIFSGSGLLSSISGFYTGNTDLFITGGTYDNNTGIATFTNSTGGTFSVSGFNTTTQFTGGTVSGETNFTNGLSANTISATTYLNLPIDADTYVTGFTFDQITYLLKLDQNTNNPLYSSFTANLAILASDVTITGGSYNANTGVATFTNNSGGTFDISGFTTGITDTIITDFSYTPSANTFTILQSNNSAFTVTFDTVSGLTVNGALSATTYLGLPIDLVITGGTYSNGTLSLTNNTGVTITVSGFSTGYTLTTSAITSTLGYTPLSGNGTATRVAFWDTVSSISSDNSLYWDNVNKRLGVGTAVPVTTLDITGNINVGGASNVFGNGYQLGTSIGNISGFLELSGSEGRKFLVGNGGIGNAQFEAFNGNRFSFTYNPILGGIFPSEMVRIYPSISYTGGTNSFTNFLISSSINNTGGTNTIRGVYYNPQINSLSGTTHIAWENTSGDIIFRNLSGSTTRMVVVNSGGTLSTQDISGFTDTFITGGTYSNGTLSLTNNTGATITISGFYTFGSEGDANTYITGGTFNSSGLTLRSNSGDTIVIPLSSNTWSVSGNTISGDANKLGSLNNAIVNLISSGLTIASVATTGLTMNPTSISTNQGSRRLNFQGYGASTNLQQGSIFYEGGGGTSGGAFQIVNSNGSINLAPSNSTIWLPNLDTQIYSNNGSLRLTNNNATKGFIFGNGAFQTGGTLFQVSHLYTNPSQITPFTIFPTGNSVFAYSGTIVDAGYRVDVLGTTRLSGNTQINGTFTVKDITDVSTFAILNSVGTLTLTPTSVTGGDATSALDISQTWNTSGAPSAIRVNITNTNSGSVSKLIDLRIANQNIFSINQFAQGTFGNGSNNVGLGSATAGTGAGAANGTALRLFSQGGNTAGYDFWFTPISSRQPGSGVSGGISVTGTFAPTSGGSGATYNHLNLTPTINQGTGATGISRGIFINPTLTSAADFRVIESTNGRVVLTDTISATGTSTNPILDLTQTFNTSGTPTSLRLSVVNTSASTSSLLMDLRAGTGGTTSLFTVRASDGLTTMRSAVVSSATQNVLTVVGSGSSTTAPIFSVNGSQGQLFSVTDSLTGSLFSVNDISGLPILEVFSDNTTLMGSYLAPSLNTTTRAVVNSGTTNIYSIPTSAYTGAFYDYTISNSGGTRAGNVMAIWSGTTAQFTETNTLDIGTTTGFSFNVIVSGSSAILRSSATTNNWTVKTIVRSI